MINTQMASPRIVSKDKFDQYADQAVTDGKVKSKKEAIDKLVSSGVSYPGMSPSGPITIDTSLKRSAARTGSEGGEARQTLDKFNPIGQATQRIDDKVQKIPTVSRDAVAEKLQGTPFEGMEVLPTMALNTPGSLAKLGSATLRGLTNPLDTAVGLGKLAFTKEGRQAVADRYGSKEGLKTALTEDPVGLASDVLTVAGGGANLAAKGAKLAGAADTAAKLGSFGEAALGASDVGLGKAVPMVANSAIQTTAGIPVVSQVVKAGLKVAGQGATPLPGEEGKDFSQKLAEGITRTAQPQDKLFKAASPAINVLNKKVDIQAKRANMDRANQIIVDYGLRPTDTQSRVEAHQKAIKNLGDELKQIRGGGQGGINMESVADAMLESVADAKKSGVAAYSQDIKNIERQAKEWKKKGIVDIPDSEVIKQLTNSIINNRGDSQLKDVYKNAMQKASVEIGKQQDAALAAVPGEYAEKKRDFGALLGTFDDVVKANLKNQKKAGDSLAETYSRIEGAGELVGGLMDILTLNGKEGAKGIAKGIVKTVMGKALGRAKDANFLVEQGFKGLESKPREGFRARDTTRDPIPTIGPVSTQPSPVTSTLSPKAQNSIESRYGIPDGSFEGKTPRQVNSMKIRSEFSLPSTKQKTGTITKAGLAQKNPDRIPKVNNEYIPEKMLSKKGGVLTVKPNNQLKFNQGDYYEPVRLVVNDKDAKVARFGALTTKSTKADLSSAERGEMSIIEKDLGLSREQILKRHQYLKDEAKRVRSTDEQVLHEIDDSFRNKPIKGLKSKK